MSMVCFLHTVSVVHHISNPRSMIHGYHGEPHANTVAARRMWLFKAK